MKKKTHIGMNVGISSIVVIFVLLCLVVFATLSLVSANADYKLSKKSALHTTSYYTACNKAEETLHDIDGLLESAYASSQNKEGYNDTIQELLTEKGFLVEEKGDFTSVSFSIPISESQELLVALEANYPLKDGSAYYTLTTWIAHSTKEWNADENLTLLGGE